MVVNPLRRTQMDTYAIKANDAYSAVAEETIQLEEKMLTVDREISGIELDAEMEAMETSASVTGIPSLKKKLLIENKGYQLCLNERDTLKIALRRARAAEECAKATMWTQVYLLKGE